MCWANGNNSINFETGEILGLVPPCLSDPEQATQSLNKMKIPGLPGSF